jgi:hypothetical protein
LGRAKRTKRALRATAQRVKAKQEGSRVLRTAQNVPEQRVEKATHWVWRKGFFSSSHAAHPPEQFGFGDRERIFERQRIALHDQDAPPVVDFVADDAMGYEVIMASAEDNVTGPDRSGFNAIDSEQITRTNGRQHARTKRHHPQFAERTEDLRGKIELNRVSKVRTRWRLRQARFRFGFFRCVHA